MDEEELEEQRQRAEAVASVGILVESLCDVGCDDVAVAAGEVANAARVHPDAVFGKVPRLLESIKERIHGPSGDPAKDHGEVPVRIWEGLVIVGLVKDMSTIFPSLGESYFNNVYDIIESIAEKNELKESDAALAQLTVTLLNLWSPGIGSLAASRDRATNAIMKLVAKPNTTVKYSASTVLEAIAKYQPDEITHYTENLIKSMSSGFVVAVPVLDELFRVQGDVASDLFEKHVHWLFKMFDSEPKQRPALALLFRNMAKRSPAVMEPYVQRIWHGLEAEDTVLDIAFALAHIARPNPKLLLARVDDLQKTRLTMPHAGAGVSHLLGSIALSSRGVAATCTEEMMAIIDESGYLPDTQVAVLNDLRDVEAAFSGVLGPHIFRIQALIMSEFKQVRDVAYRTLTGNASALGATVMRVPLTHATKDEVRHAVFGTFYVRETQPWGKYYEVPKSERKVNMPLVLMIMRTDGKIGFPGGQVEEQETLMSALQREFRDEIAYQGDIDGLDHIATHHFQGEMLRTHFYAKEVSLETFEEIERVAREAPHWGSEVMGVFRAPLLSMGQGRGPESFFRGAFVNGVLNGLIDLLVERGLMEKDEIREWCVGAGLPSGMVDEAVPPMAVQAVQKKKNVMGSV